MLLRRLPEFPSNTLTNTVDSAIVCGCVSTVPGLAMLCLVLALVLCGEADCRKACGHLAQLRF